MKSIHQFVRGAGSQEKAADLLNTNRQQIQRWLKRDAIIIEGKLYAPIKRLESGEHYKVIGEANGNLNRNTKRAKVRSD